MLLDVCLRYRYLPKFILTSFKVDDELKRMKNPRLMTARQRAMMEKEKKSDGTDDTFPVIPAEPLLSLPSGGLDTT